MRVECIVLRYSEVREAVMSPILVLEVSKSASKPLPSNGKNSNNKPISLLVFLRAENRKLHDIVAKLEHDMKALRLALGKN